MLKVGIHYFALKYFDRACDLSTEMQINGNFLLLLSFSLTSSFLLSLFSVSIYSPPVDYYLN